MSGRRPTKTTRAAIRETARHRLAVLLAYKSLGLNNKQMAMLMHVSFSRYRYLYGKAKEWSANGEIPDDAIGIIAALLSLHLR